MPDVWLAVPGDLATATGGYAYARRLIAALPETGWHAHLLPLPARFPFPTRDDLEAAQTALATLPAGAPVIVDGLAYGALPRALLDGLACKPIALVHHPLALETGLSRDDAQRLRASERAALGAAWAVIVTSDHTADILAQDYGVSAGRIHIARPGIDAAPRAISSGPPLRLLSVGTITPRKGFDALLRALATLAGLPWSCTIVGSLERDTATAADLRRLIEDHSLQKRIVLAGELSEAGLARAYADADLFILASRYEGYGMVFAEALARGLPIIACRAGAVPQTVPAGAGILVPVDDEAALADALRTIMSDDAMRAQMADESWRHGQALPRWHETARIVAAALERASA